MSESLEQETVEGFQLKVFHDDDYRVFEDEFSNEKGDKVIVCSFFHRTSILKDNNPFETASEMNEYAVDNGYEVYQLFRYEHGQVAFRAGLSNPGYPFNDQWDAGIEGYALVRREVEDEDEDLLEVANLHLDYLSDWCNGEIYGFTLEDDDGEELDSCWGFVGMDNCLGAGREAAVVYQKSLPQQLSLLGGGV